MSGAHELEAKRVVARVGRGNSSPVLCEVGSRRLVLKLRGAGHGVHALVAEIVVSSLAQALGLAVPELVMVRLLPDFTSEDKNDELDDLLKRSIGLNVGYEFLQGSQELRPREIEGLSEEYRAAVLWLDELTMNPDRTAMNPNILLWRGQPWLIDHGSALSFQYDFRALDEEEPRARVPLKGHVFEGSRPTMGQMDSELAARIDRAAVAHALSQVPDSFLASVGPETTTARNRALYEAYLWKRLKAPRPFLGEAAQ